MIVSVNGTDLETAGYSLTSLEGWGFAMDRQFASAPLPNRAGHLVAGFATMQPRIIRMGVLVSGTSKSDLEDQTNKLLALFTGTIALSFGDSDTRSIDAVLTGVSSEMVGDRVNTWHIDDRVVTLTLTCYDAAKYDTTATVANISSTPTSITVGTWAHGGQIRINGTATNPVITYKDRNGATAGTMTLTASIASGDWVEVDTETMTITKSVSGVESTDNTLWTAGDFFTIDPADADLSAASYGTLEISSGTGTFTYQRRWI